MGLTKVVTNFAQAKQEVADPHCCLASRPLLAKVPPVSRDN